MFIYLFNISIFFKSLKIAFKIYLLSCIYSLIWQTYMEPLLCVWHSVGCLKNTEINKTMWQLRSPGVSGLCHFLWVSSVFGLWQESHSGRRYHFHIEVGPEEKGWWTIFVCLFLFKRRKLLPDVPTDFSPKALMRLVHVPYPKSARGLCDVVTTTGA